MADMWVHEGFTAYSENLYLDYHFGKQAASDYVIGTRGNIQNDKPIIGTYNVNQSGSGDMYYKGANMLHTIRQLVNDDEKWRTILRGLNREFYHQTVTTKQIEEYIGNTSGIDLSQFFDQYLRTSKIPMLEYQVNGNQIRFRYTNIVDGFDMPLKLSINGTVEWVYPTSDWKSKSFEKDIKSVNVDKNFYVEYKTI